MTVPGVNVIVAATFIAAVGDIRRFPDRRKLTAYLGLDPRVRQSGAGLASARPHLQARLDQRPARARRGVLVDGPPARPDRRLLSTHQGTPRPLDRDRRLSAKARVSVLVPAHSRRGLRVRAAIADQEEDAPPRAAGRRPAPAGRPRHLVDQRRDAPSRTRACAPSPARLRTHDQRPPSEQGGCGRDTGPRIAWLVKRARRAADHRPKVCALTRRRPRPPELFHDRRRSSKPT